MILADTSVWIQHIRKSLSDLQPLLETTQVAMHPFVLGELACGNLPDRTRFIAALHNLPSAPVCEDAFVLNLIEQNHLNGRGLGWMDMHLLASATQHEHQIWTLDERFAEIAEDLDMAFPG